jgi:hypothetical protein
MLNITTYQENAYQNHVELSSHLVRIAIIKKTKNKNTDEGAEKRIVYTVSGNVN